MSAGDNCGRSSLSVSLFSFAVSILTFVDEEVDALAAMLGRLDLRPVDEATADLAAVLGATHRLRAVDATHLATAVIAGADRFITDNSSDFPTSIPEIHITYPQTLPAR